MIAKFPAFTEQKRYLDSRITNIVREYIPSMIDGECKLQKYFQNKNNRIKKYNVSKNGRIKIPEEIFESEIQKFFYIKEVMKKIRKRNR